MLKQNASMMNEFKQGSRLNAQSWSWCVCQTRPCALHSACSVIAPNAIILDVAPPQEAQAPIAAPSIALTTEDRSIARQREENARFLQEVEAMVRQEAQRGTRSERPAEAVVKEAEKPKDVAELLAQLNLSQYTARLEEEGIELSVLVSLMNSASLHLVPNLNTSSFALLNLLSLGSATHTSLPSIPSSPVTASITRKCPRLRSLLTKGCMNYLTGDRKEALDEALKEAGVSSVGHRLKILAALQ